MLRCDLNGLKGIERLQKKKKGVVYRLMGAGPGGSDVIAKMSSRARVARERSIYELVLPTLAIPTVHYYGFVEEPDHKNGWLFLEDAGRVEYSPLTEEHRVLAGRWLGLLHTSAATSAAATRLADRGPGYYLQHLRSACDLIRRNLSNPALTDDDRALLKSIIAQCEVVASHWSQVESLCEGMPHTFIHGDFAPKNIRVRIEKTGIALLPFDWANAGWGFIASDLAQAGVGSSGHSTGATLIATGQAPISKHTVRCCRRLGLT